MQRVNHADEQRRVANTRNEAIQAELDAMAAGRARSLKRRTSDGVEAREDRPQAATPSADWLNRAIAAILRTFGEHMDARITSIAEQGEVTAGRLEDHIDRVDMMDRHWHEYADTTNRRLGRHEDHMQRVVNTTTEMKSELEATNKKLAELEERLRAKELEEAARPRQRVAPPPQAASSSHQDHQRPTDRPHQQPHVTPQTAQRQTTASIGPRLWARVGNLESRLDQALEDAKVDPDTIATMHAVVGRDGKGSAAEIEFTSEANLQIAKGKFRNTRLSVVPGKSIWLDVKKLGRNSRRRGRSTGPSRSSWTSRAGGRIAPCSTRTSAASSSSSTASARGSP